MGIGVIVEIGIIVGIGVVPGLQPATNIINRTSTTVTRCFVSIGYPATITGAPGGYSSVPHNFMMVLQLPNY
jgi:hypothetical protein